jgi:DNA-binding NarL/FixJ family response regulator
VLDGLRLLLDSQADLKVIGAVTSGQEVVRQVIRTHPDVVVMDIAMPELNGVEATRQIHAAAPGIRIVMLSMHSTSEHIFQALRAGALGYVLKQSAGTELVEAIRAVHAGRPYLSQKLTESVETEPEREMRSPLERITKRELEVLQLTVEGKSAAEIARHLSLTPGTVATYRWRLMHKLGLSDLPSLVKFAIQHGLTPPL